LWWLAALALTTAEDCCWVEHASKGATLKRPRKAIAACDERHACFVSCAAKGRPAPGACECNAPQHQREANLTQEKVARSQHMRSVYSGAWLAPYNVSQKVDWHGLVGYELEAASYGVFREAASIWRSALPESFKVMHLSAYEHSVVARNSFAEAMRRVDAVVAWQLRDLCGTLARRWPHYTKTGAVVPFFGGVARQRYIDSADAQKSTVDTGNAHSLQPRSIKARALKASVCGLLRDVASEVRVVVCDDIAGDRAAVQEVLGDLATVIEVPCKSKPKHLPFLALDDAVAAFAEKDFLAFGEADLTWRFASVEAGTAAASLFRVVPDAVLTPHRWHKRYGSQAACGDGCATQPTGQNLCSLRSGARLAAVARLSG